MSEAECVMNSKSEFHQSPLVRVVAVTGLQEEQGEELDIGQGGRGEGGGALAWGGSAEAGAEAQEVGARRPDDYLSLSYL